MFPYSPMMPLCGDMAGVAKGIAGLGALFYVAYRVWQSLARAEPIDVFPMLRPFAIGLCIMFFQLLVKFLVGHEVGGFGVAYHRLVFQFVLLLPVSVHVQRGI